MIEADGWITVHPKLPEPFEAALHEAFDPITEEEIPEDLTRQLDALK